mgnify:CR=1 FL=1
MQGYSVRSASNHSNPTRVAGPAPAGAMNFPAQEQKPVRIVLDN